MFRGPPPPMNGLNTLDHAGECALGIIAGYCQSNRQGSPLFDPLIFPMLRRESVSIIPGDNRMTISFRFFGYSICLSIAKVITVPCDRLDLWS
jgi:hypothetical protein